MPSFNIAPQWVEDVKNVGWGTLPTANNSSIGTDFAAWDKFSYLLKKSSTAGKLYSTDIVSTYSLVYTAADAYIGGVVAPNGDVHFIPLSANRGQKISAAGVVSTYSLLYTGIYAYFGGVLAPNGDIHFVPFTANRGQKVDKNGVVSTYALVYTNSSGAYNGGTVLPDGAIHFTPWLADRGQKISAAGVVSTYTLTTTTAATYGGVLGADGKMYTSSYNWPLSTIDVNGVMTTYNGAYPGLGGAINPKGEIYFAPYYQVGSKINTKTKEITTISFVNTTTDVYYGAVASPNGDIHFVPYNAAVGQKVDINGTVSTYSLLKTGSLQYHGGILAPNGDIHFVPRSANVGQKVNTMLAIPLDIGITQSPWFNKY